jgi:hypothetical protein
VKDDEDDRTIRKVLTRKRIGIANKRNEKISPFFMAPKF